MAPLNPRAHRRAYEFYRAIDEVYKIVADVGLQIVPHPRAELDELVIGNDIDNGRSQPARLSNDKFLNVEITLRERSGMDHIETSRATFTYTDDREGRREIFSYNYVRDNDDKYPKSHVHIEGSRLHVPTRRITLEQVIWYLIHEHEVKVRPHVEVDKKWHRILWRNESEFRDVQKDRVWPYDMPFPEP